MSPGAEGRTSVRAEGALPVEEPHRRNGHGSSGHHPHLHHPHLLEPQEDRWAWRRKIRSSPHRLRVYRVVVGLAGLLLVALGVISGPLPGPGGIPLVLLGLAVWASEFRWAHRLMLRFKHALHVFRTWSRPRKLVAWVVFFLCCGLLGYGYLLLIGPPDWLPQRIDLLLDRLPGV